MCRVYICVNTCVCVGVCVRSILNVFLKTCTSVFSLKNRERCICTHMKNGRVCVCVSACFSTSVSAYLSVCMTVFKVVCEFFCVFVDVCV